MPQALTSAETAPTRIYEFAVEHGFSFDYREVAATDAKSARRQLWDDMSDAERNCVSDIELVGERAA